MPTRSLLALLALVLVLSGCAASSTEIGINRTDPTAVNAAWVAAVRDNDREAAAALYDAGSAEANSYNINNYLTSMADNIHPVGKPRFNYGAFQAAEALDVQDVGAGKRAFSRWVFANSTLCYVADLSLSDGAWTVTSWGFTTATENCDG